MPSLNKTARCFSARHPVLLRLVALALLLALLALCWRWGAAQLYQGPVKVPIENGTLDTSFSRLAISDADLNTDETSAQRVSLDAASEELAILKGGDYQLQGTLDGRIRINAHDEIVHLFFNGVTVTSANGPALLVEDADRVVITILSGSQNALADSGSYRDVGDADACIFCACDLVFNGDGFLEIKGVYQDAVHCKDVLKIAAGAYRVESKRSGLRGNDGVHIAGGTIFIGSEKYGVRTTKQGEDGRGDILVHDCALSIVAGRYAFVADRADAYIYSAEVQTNSVIDDFSVQGRAVAEEGCIQ